MGIWFPTVVTANGRRVLHRGPPANGQQGRRQATDGLIRATLPNGQSTIVTSVEDAVGRLTELARTVVIVEGMHESGLLRG